MKTQETKWAIDPTHTKVKFQGETLDDLKRFRTF